MTDHTLVETEDYFGFIRIVRMEKARGGRRIVEPVAEAAYEELSGEASGGLGNLYRQGCACGWRSSWAYGKTDAQNGGRAHLRAARKRED